MVKLIVHFAEIIVLYYKVIVQIEPVMLRAKNTAYAGMYMTIKSSQFLRHVRNKLTNREKDRRKNRQMDWLTGGFTERHTYRRCDYYLVIVETIPMYSRMFASQARNF